MHMCAHTHTCTATHTYNQNLLHVSLTPVALSLCPFFLVWVKVAIKGYQEKNQLDLESETWESLWASSHPLHLLPGDTRESLASVWVLMLWFLVAQGGTSRRCRGLGRGRRMLWDILPKFSLTELEMTLRARMRIQGWPRQINLGH